MGIISAIILVAMPAWLLIYFCGESRFRKFSHRGATFELDE